jgi:UDPglucose 6-dehydrogenase
MRESPSLVILPVLKEAGATVRAFDPEGMSEARKLLPGVEFGTSAYEVMTGADALVVLTEWNEFRALDPARIKSLMRTPVVVDLRNIYNPGDMASAGFSYVSIGRPNASPEASGAA